MFGSEHVRRTARKVRDAVTLASYWRPTNWRIIEALEGYRDIHAGERCFILGNGPSLAETDLRPLEDEVTFGLNRIYLNFEEMGYETTYLVSVNGHVIRQFIDEIQETSCAKFLSWHARQHVQDTSEVVFLRSRSGPKFCRDLPREGVWEGATVTYVAMQLAFFMGFEEVILLGVDHSFETEGDPHELVESDGPDPNHFHPDYFGEGTEWSLPDLETSEQAYSLAKRAFEGDGRKIWDATLGGELDVFDKIDYADVPDLSPAPSTSQVPVDEQVSQR